MPLSPDLPEARLWPAIRTCPVRQLTAHFAAEHVLNYCNMISNIARVILAQVVESKCRVPALSMRGCHHAQAFVNRSC